MASDDLHPPPITPTGATMIRLPKTPLTREQVDAAVASLNSVGGIYDYIARAVEAREGARCE